MYIPAIFKKRVSASKSMYQSSVFIVMPCNKLLQNSATYNKQLFVAVSPHVKWSFLVLPGISHVSLDTCQVRRCDQGCALSHDGELAGYWLVSDDLAENTELVFFRIFYPATA